MSQNLEHITSKASKFVGLAVPLGIMGASMLKGAMDASKDSFQNPILNTMVSYGPGAVAAIFGAKLGYEITTCDCSENQAINLREAGRGAVLGGVLGYAWTAIGYGIGFGMGYAYSKCLE